MPAKQGLVIVLEKLLQGVANQEHREVIVTFTADNALILVLIGLMLLDVITGLIAAAIHKEVDSSYSFRGVLKKAQMLLMVAAGLLFEFIYPDIPWGKLIAGLMCLTEMISIVENAGKAGVPLPEQLKDVLKRLRASKENELVPKVEVRVHAPQAKEIKVHDTDITLRDSTPPAEENPNGSS